MKFLGKHTYVMQNLSINDEPDEGVVEGVGVGGDEATPPVHTKSHSLQECYYYYYNISRSSFLIPEASGASYIDSYIDSVHIGWIAISVSIIFFSKLLIIFYEYGLFRT